MWLEKKVWCNTTDRGRESKHSPSVAIFLPLSMQHSVLADMWRDLSERRAFRKKRARVTFLAFIVWKKRNSGSTACYSRKTRAAVRRAGQGEALLLRLHQKEAFWSLIKELSGFKSHSFGSIVVWCLAPSKLEEIMKSHIVWNPIISHQHILDWLFS